MIFCCFELKHNFLYLHDLHLDIANMLELELELELESEFELVLLLLLLLQLLLPLPLPLPLPLLLLKLLLFLPRLECPDEFADVQPRRKKRFKAKKCPQKKSFKGKSSHWEVKGRSKNVEEFKERMKNFSLLCRPFRQRLLEGFD